MTSNDASSLAAQESRDADMRADDSPSLRVFPPPEDGVPDKIDWTATRRSILSRLDIREEYTALGLQLPSSEADDRGWLAISKTDANGLEVETGINVRTGHYAAFGANGEQLDLFEFAVKHGGFETYPDALNDFAGKAGVQMPTFRQDEDGAFVEGTYHYLDAQGDMAFETIHYRLKDGTLGRLTRRVTEDGSPEHGLVDSVTVPYRLPELLESEPNRGVFILGSELDVERAVSEGLVGTCLSKGNDGTAPWRRLAPHLDGRTVIVVASGDERDRRETEETADAIAAHAKSVRIARLPVPAGGGLGDFLDLGYSVGELREIYRAAPAWSPVSIEVTPTAAPEGLRGFLENPPEPEPIRDQLLAVEVVTPDVLPAPFRPWLVDIAERMQCPLEFAAAGALVSLASLVGRRMTIRPKRHDDWTVIPNLWGGIVGRPGVMKSPALTSAMKPMRLLEKRAREAFEAEVLSYQRDAALAKSRTDQAQRDLAVAIKGGHDDDALRELADQAAAIQRLQPPGQKRYILNEPTIEKLGEILAVNTNGVLVFRDELTGFLRTLDKPGRESDRAFYLEGWNGNNPFVFDRIGRGSNYIPAVCISILGGIQPGPLGDYFRAAAKNGADHDGLVSRFQLLVCPDDPGEWRNVDRWPNHEAAKRATDIFEKLGELDGLSIGANFDDPDSLPFLRFDPSAQDLFDQWRYDLENGKLRSQDEDPLIICHLAKYRSLMPKLALLFHLIDVASEEATGPVSLRSAELAAAWCDILESHARRIYDGFGDPTASAARALASRIKKGCVPDKFSFSWVAQKGWSSLGTASDVTMAVEKLEAHGWVHRETFESGPQGGRPATVVHINPRLRGAGR